MGVRTNLIYALLPFLTLKIYTVREDSIFKSLEFFYKQQLNIKELSLLTSYSFHLTVMTSEDELEYNLSPRLCD